MLQSRKLSLFERVGAHPLHNFVHRVQANNHGFLSPGIELFIGYRFKTGLHFGHMHLDSIQCHFGTSFDIDILVPITCFSIVFEPLDTHVFQTNCKLREDTSICPMLERVDVHWPLGFRKDEQLFRWPPLFVFSIRPSIGIEWCFSVNVSRSRLYNQCR